MTLWRIIIKVAFFLLIAYFTFLFFPAPPSLFFLDGVNLMIHEAGHLIFIFFGQMMSMLGGTIFQLLIPVSISLYFLLQKDYFSLAFTLFWIGDNLLNISTYIKDALAMNLPLLVTGSIHDWNWLLSEWGLLEHAQTIGGLIYLLGTLALISCLLIMLLAIVLDIKTLVSQRTTA